MTIYIVTVNGKPNQQAYTELSQAQEFVLRRIGKPTEEQVAQLDASSYYDIEHNGYRYTIYDARTA